jgi:hypothetical protein
VDRELIAERILEHVGRSPSPLTARQVCDAIDGDPRAVYPVLKKLREAGELKASFQDSTNLIEYARPAPGEAVPTGPVVPLSRRKHNGRPSNGRKANGRRADASHFKEELFDVISTMVGENAALLKLIRLHGAL